MRIQNVRQSRTKSSLPASSVLGAHQSASNAHRKLSYSFQADDLTIESAYNLRSPTNSIPAIQRRSSLANSLQNSVDDKELADNLEQSLVANYTTIADETDSVGRVREKATLIE